MHNVSMDEQEMKRLLKQFRPSLLRLLANGRKSKWVSDETKIPKSKLSRLKTGVQEPSLEDAVLIENLCKRLSKISLVG